MSVLEGVVGMGNEIRNPKSEILNVMRKPEPGDVVVIDGTGTVPVKVSGEGGAIRRGDLLTTASLGGHAKKASFADAGTLGVAMAEEDFATASTSVITVLL